MPMVTTLFFSGIFLHILIIIFDGLNLAHIEDKGDIFGSPVDTSLLPFSKLLAQPPLLFWAVVAAKLQTILMISHSFLDRLLRLFKYMCSINRF